MSTTTEVPIADVSAEPDRVRAFPLGNYDRKPMRVIKYEWVVREDANGDEIIVDLYCGHTRGGYYARIGNERQQPDGVTVSSPMSSERLPSERCARYNKREVRGVRRAQAGRTARAGRRRPVRRLPARRARARPLSERPQRAACERPRAERDRALSHDCSPKAGATSDVASRFGPCPPTTRCVRPPGHVRAGSARRAGESGVSVGGNTCPQK